MTRLKTVFFGTPEFALASLKETHEKTDLIAVVTQPDKARGRKQLLLPCPVKEMASTFGCQIFDPPSLKKPSDALKVLKDFLLQNSVDLFVVVAYGNLLTQEFLNFPKWGAVNIHSSLLPKWRGAAPMQRSLEAGDDITGVCLQKMVFELDAGDVFLSEDYKIQADDNYQSLSISLSELGAGLLGKFFEKLTTKNSLSGKPQAEAQVSFAAKIKKEEGYWDDCWGE